jgi:hypothetical protein
MSHVQYMLRSLWNVYVSCTAVCFGTSVIRSPRGMVGTEEEIALERIKKKKEYGAESVCS